MRPNRDTSLGVICQSMGRHHSILTVFMVVIAASTVVDVCVLCVYAFFVGGGGGGGGHKNIPVRCLITRMNVFTLIGHVLTRLHPVYSRDSP